MARLSGDARKRLEDAVIASASVLEGSSMLKRLHMDRPDPFALFVVKYIPMDFTVRRLLDPSDMNADFDECMRRVRNTIRRLLRKGKLRKELVDVPVLQSNGAGGKHIVERPMTCYFPTKVLDELAKC